MRWKWLLVILTVGVLSVAGCAFPYYMQAIGGQVSLLRQRVPISEVIADSSYDEATRDGLRLVTELRRFAVSALGLPDNDSYTSYVDLGRDYVVWNVVAAEEFSVDPLAWCFPVAGCVSYRGYFRRERAEAFAENLRADGYDVFTGGSAAYSTLGHFADPVLSTMLARADSNVAATLFHELAHQQAYVKDDTELSESFATAVEQYGVETWLRSAERREDLAAYRSAVARQREFAALVQRQRERLGALFASGVAASAMRQRKAESFAEMRDEYRQLKARWGNRVDYDNWFAGELNNASLVAVTSYQRWVPGIRARLELLGPVRFFEEFEGLIELAPAEREERLERWNSASATAGLTDQRQRIGMAGEVGADDRLHAFGLDAERREAIVAANAGDAE